MIETVSVVDLEENNRVKLLGKSYVVTKVEKVWANERNITLKEMGGSDELVFEGLEYPVAKFDRIVPDPEEFRVRSVIMPSDFWAEFVDRRTNSSEVVITAYKMGGFFSTIVVDKADLKAVVEKL